MTRTPITTHTPPRELATVAEVSARYRKSPNRIREAARQGRLPFFRVGSSYRFDLDALDDLFRQDATSPIDGALSITPAGRRTPARVREESPPPG